MMKNIYTTFVAILIAIAPLNAVAASIDTAAKQAIVFDVDTGTVLLEKNPDQQMPTSSMSKVLTAYLIFDALKAGTLSPDDTFTVSEKAWRKGGSKMFVEVNKQVEIMDLLRGVIIQSGNDATIVLAEGLSGSEEAFAGAMNEKARELGMENSNFMNASGWPDPKHYSTARDLGKLAEALIENHPEYYKIYSEKEFSYNDIPQQNRNPLLYQNIGADGVKTGHTEVGGYGLIGSGVSGDRRVIFVINGLESSAARAQESKKLLQWALNSFKNETLVQANAVVGKAEVLLGEQDSVNLTVNEDVELTVPHNADRDIEITTQYEGPLKAPIKQGDAVGKLVISIPNQPDVTQPIYAASDVEAKGFISQTLYKAKTLVLGQ